MAKKTSYYVTRVPSNHWDNIMETVTLDGSYSEEIKNEVWTAIENMEDFSDPWVVVKIVDGKATTKIFNNKDSAQKYIKRANKKSSEDEQYFCVKGYYQSNR